MLGTSSERVDATYGPEVIKVRMMDSCLFLLCTPLMIVAVSVCCVSTDSGCVRNAFRCEEPVRSRQLRLHPRPVRRDAYGPPRPPAPRNIFSGADLLYCF